MHAEEGQREPLDTGECRHTDDDSAGLCAACLSNDVAELRRLAALKSAGEETCRELGLVTTHYEIECVSDTGKTDVRGPCGSLTEAKERRAWAISWAARHNDTVHATIFVVTRRPIVDDAETNTERAP